MKKSLVYLSLSCLLIGLLALAGCGKKEETTIEETTSASTTTEPSTTTPMGTDMGTDMGTSTMGTDMGTMGSDMKPPAAQ
jgi:ABC-type oligopeptide transport system substrate-binding subunit